jgi:hypothetical protein
VTELQTTERTIDALCDAFVARTTLNDRDVECHEGRQMLFVDADRLPDVDLVRSRNASFAAASRSSTGGGGPPAGGGPPGGGGPPPAPPRGGGGD